MVACVFLVLAFSAICKVTTCKNIIKLHHINTVFVLASRKNIFGE